MSDTPFIEAFSTDPVVRDIHRRVVRVLNDPTLGRSQRVTLVRKLQQMLIEHQLKQAAQPKPPFNTVNKTANKTITLRKPHVK